MTDVVLELKAVRPHRALHEWRAPLTMEVRAGSFTTGAVVSSSDPSGAAPALTASASAAPAASSARTPAIAATVLDLTPILLTRTLSLSPADRPRL